MVSHSVTSEGLVTIRLSSYIRVIKCYIVSFVIIIVVYYDQIMTINCYFS